MPKRKKIKITTSGIESPLLRKIVIPRVRPIIRIPIVKRKREKKKHKKNYFDYIEYLSIEVFSLFPSVCPVCKEYKEKHEQRVKKIYKDIKLDPANFRYRKYYVSSDYLVKDIPIDVYFRNYLIAKGLCIESFPAFLIRVRLKGGIKRFKIFEGLPVDVKKAILMYLISLKSLVKEEKESKTKTQE